MRFIGLMPQTLIGELSGEKEVVNRTKLALDYVSKAVRQRTDSIDFAAYGEVVQDLKTLSPLNLFSMTFLRGDEMVGTFQNVAGALESVWGQVGGDDCLIFIIVEVLDSLTELASACALFTRPNQQLIFLPVDDEATEPLVDIAELLAAHTEAGNVEVVTDPSRLNETISDCLAEPNAA